MTYWEYYRNPEGSDAKLRRLARVYSRDPDNEELREQWLQQRLRMNLPIFKIHAYLELWPLVDEDEDPGEPDELDLYTREVNFSGIIEAAKELRVQWDNILGSSTWLSRMVGPDYYNRHAPNWVELPPLPYELDAVAFALDVRYIDNRELADEDIIRIQDILSETS